MYNNLNSLKFNPMIKKIDIQLLSGEALKAKKIRFDRGFEIAVITMPRKEITKYSDLKELSQHSLYLLLDVDHDHPKIYIGEAKSFLKRSRTHKNSAKTRLKWDRAIILAKDSERAIQEFEKSQVQYFEYLAYKKMTEMESPVYTVVNDQAVVKPYINQYSKQTLESDFKAFIEILEVLNISPFIEKTPSLKEKKSDQEPTPLKTSKRSSWTDAAYQILLDNNKAMHYREITKQALQKELIKTAGKTPAATMGAGLYTEASRANSRFIKIKTGIWDLNKAFRPRNNKKTKPSRDASKICKLSDASNLKGFKLRSINIRETYSQDVRHWSDALKYLLDVSYQLDKNICSLLTKDQRTSRFISCDPQKFRSAVEIMSTGHYVDTTNNTDCKVMLMQRIADLAHLDQDEIVFILV